MAFTPVGSMIKRVAMLALISGASAIALLAFCQWTAAGPTPSAQEVTDEFSAALPVGSSEDEIVAYLDRRGLGHSTHTTGSGEVIVLDDGVPAGVRVIEARIEQHDNRPISLGTEGLILSFVMTDEHKLDRLVVLQLGPGL